MEEEVYGSKWHNKLGIQVFDINQRHSMEKSHHNVRNMRQK